MFITFMKREKKIKKRRNTEIKLNTQQMIRKKVMCVLSMKVSQIE